LRIADGILRLRSQNPARKTNAQRILFSES
jgi:hypothetical protein